VRFSPDGLRLVTSTAKPARIRIWDVLTGQPLTDWIDWSGGAIGAVRFSSDGAAIIASAGWKWPFHPISGSAPVWLPELAEAIAGVRYNANRLSEPVTEEAFLKFQWQFAQRTETNALVVWARELWAVGGGEVR
jgi:hypothetical protein